MIAVSLLPRAFPLADMQRHLVGDEPVRALRGNRLFQLNPRVPAGFSDQLAETPHLTGGLAARLCAGTGVIMAPSEIPKTSAVGTQPERSSLANSCGDRCEVNGAAGRFSVRARMAVPITLNSVPPAGNGLMLSLTPTTPSPPSAWHSSIARERACLRTPYRFLSRALNESAEAEARSVPDAYDPIAEHLAPWLT